MRGAVVRDIVVAAALLVLAFIVAMALTNCAAAVAPDRKQPTGPTCTDACTHLRDLSCESGQPSAGGTTCEEVCELVESTGVEEIRWPRACVAAAETCAAAERCGE